MPFRPDVLAARAPVIELPKTPSQRAASIDAEDKRVLRSKISDDAYEIVPPPLDSEIPTDDELDAQCDQLMRFEVEASLVTIEPTPK